MTRKMSRRKSSKMYKKGGECNRNCTIRPGCSGNNRFYNPETQTCEFDFQGIHKMVGGKYSRDHSKWAEYALLKDNPKLIRIADGYIPLNKDDPADLEKYEFFIYNAIMSGYSKKQIEDAINAKNNQSKGLLAAYWKPVKDFFDNKSGGARKKSRTKSKKSKRRRKMH